MYNGNILIVQSGGSTAVINSSLSGIIREARERFPLSRILGADHGIDCIISSNLIDLTNLSKGKLTSLDETTGAALGSSRHKILSNDIDPILDVLRKNEIRIIHIIGGNDSAETGLELSKAAIHTNYDLIVVNVPKTIDNDLVLTDHCPGYGSAARFIAQATLGAARDAWSMNMSSPITIMEVMGRDAGWLAVSSSLYKKDDSDPPHFIGVPEIPLDEEYFLSKIEECYRKNGYAVAIIAENVRGPKGVIGNQEKPWFIDGFGHQYYDGPAKHLSQRVMKELNVRCRFEKPGTIQRSLGDSVSETDRFEAHLAGTNAVRCASNDIRDVIITLDRLKGESYQCATAHAPLAEVAGKTRILPREFLPDASGNTPQDFKDYLRPLIGKPISGTYSVVL